MSSWWDYFDKYLGTTVAMCRHCTYSKDLGPSRSTGCLANHLKNHHPTLYHQKMTLSNAVKQQSAIKMEWSRKRPMDDDGQQNFELLRPGPSTKLEFETPSPINEPPPKLPKVSPINSNISVLIPRRPSIRILQPILELKESPPPESSSPDIIPISPPVAAESDPSTFVNPMSHIMHKVQDALEAVESKVSDVLHGHGHHHSHHDNSTDDTGDAVSPLHSHSSNKNRGRLARKMTIEEERGNEYFL